MPNNVYLAMPPIRDGTSGIRTAGGHCEKKVSSVKQAGICILEKEVNCTKGEIVSIENRMKMDYADRIEVNPKVMFGKPVIKGTRITVELILEELSAGKSVEDLLRAHPRLTLDGVLAALAFAADALKGEKVYRVAV